jgi:hypothetical protein
MMGEDSALFDFDAPQGNLSLYHMFAQLRQHRFMRLRNVITRSHHAAAISPLAHPSFATAPNASSPPDSIASRIPAIRSW